MLQAPYWASDLNNSVFEVTYIKARDKVKVNLSDRTYFCRLWELSGIPCKDVMATLAWNNLKRKNYVHSSYNVVVVKIIYAPFINPIIGKEYQGTSNSQPI